MKNSLSINNLSYKYNDSVIFEDISFSLQSGQIGCLLGPSGTGKTTLLRLIADLAPMQSGDITFNGQSIKEMSKSSGKFPVSMVFQDLGLFPHMSALENVRYGLKNWRSKKSKDIIQLTCEQLGITPYLHRYPHELSGGQQQRVALARALVMEPDILLLDEPFSNLDPALRVPLSEDLSELFKDKGLISIIVTHDRQEALSMGDYIGILGEKKLHQWDEPEQLLSNPNNPFVTRFTGHNALINGIITENYCVKTSIGTFELDAKQAISNFKAYDSVKVYVRSVDVIIVHDNHRGLTPATITYRNYEANEFVYAIKLDNGERLFATCHTKSPVNVGEKVSIRTMFQFARIFKAD